MAIEAAKDLRGRVALRADKPLISAVTRKPIPINAKMMVAMIFPGRYKADVGTTIAMDHPARDKGL